MLHMMILAGGGGTRLWPLSRAHYPKQFLKLLGDYTLLQQTVLRVSNLISPEQMWIVTGKEQEFLVRAQLAALPDFNKLSGNILLEPEPRNTTAAIGLAAVHILQADPQAVMVVLPADHWIEHQDIFVSLLTTAAALAQHEILITLGIVPNQPATAYGYIQRGDRRAFALPTNVAEPEVYGVVQFVEKPTLSAAQAYIASGAHYWNAGIFVWRAITILNEIATYLPQLYRGLQEIAASLTHSDSARMVAEVYRSLDVISIDCGVLERSRRLVVLPADIGWSDLGEWTTIHRLSSQDEHGNVFNGKVFNIDSENTFVHGNGRVIAIIGLQNAVVIDTEDALLVCTQDRTQEVKNVVEQLRSQEGTVVATSRTVNRPWGTYTVLEEGPSFKVKRILVNPGAALSLQLHRHRSEHWVVVSGVAEVINGDQQFTVQANQSIYISVGVIHRLTNSSTEPLEVVEVSTGSYLGEDDIVRFEDMYQRVVL